MLFWVSVGLCVCARVCVRVCPVQLPRGVIQMCVCELYALDKKHIVCGVRPALFLPSTSSPTLFLLVVFDSVHIVIFELRAVHCGA